MHSSIGSLDQWREAVEGGQALDATHGTFYTSSQGVGAVLQRIEALRQLHAAVR